jgi:hypothetical protein
MNRERIAKSCICCGGTHLKKAPAVLMPFVAKRVFDHEPIMIAPEWGMRDLKSGMAYTLCNSIQCASCGVLFLDLRFSDVEMASLYANYRDEEYTHLRDHYEPGYREICKFYSVRADYIAKIEEFLTPLVPSAPALLDWGGDTGINTPLKEQASFVHIYDISNKPSLKGTLAVDLETARQSSYDLITCSQVLEHVPYPQDVINQIISVMDAHTLLYLEVPYEELMRTEPGLTELHRIKRHWHEHINFFSEESVRSLVKGAGLTLVEQRFINISLGWRDACVISVLCHLA